MRGHFGFLLLITLAFACWATPDLTVYTLSNGTPGRTASMDNADRSLRLARKVAVYVAVSILVMGHAISTIVSRVRELDREPEASYDVTCLGCGDVIKRGRRRCASCGWSYEKQQEQGAGDGT